MLTASVASRLYLRSKLAWKYSPGLRPDPPCLGLGGQHGSKSPPMLLIPTLTWLSSLFRDWRIRFLCGNQGDGPPKAEAAQVREIKAKLCGEAGERREARPEGSSQGPAGPRSAQEKLRWVGVGTAVSCVG